MKRIITLLFVISLCQLTVFGQKKYEMVVEKTNGKETVFNVEDVVRTYFRERNDGGTDEGTSYTTCPDENHPHMIDLGLPSGTKWACCNVGASTPEDYGGYYAWGETSEKSVYNWDTYQYGYYNYDNDYSNLVNIGSDIAGTQYDVAHVRWGGGWRMPSLAQFQELLDNCTSAWWVTLNDVNGYEFTGPNGGHIFLPAAGRRWDDLIGFGSNLNYWSSTLLEFYPVTAYELSLDEYEAHWYGNDRPGGRSVRPVR